MGRGMVGERGNFFLSSQVHILVGATKKNQKIFSGESRGSGYYLNGVYYILHTSLLRRDVPFWRCTCYFLCIPMYSLTNYIWSSRQKGTKLYNSLALLPILYSVYVLHTPPYVNQYPLDRINPPSP